jgi:predicted glycosyltransferase
MRIWIDIDNPPQVRYLTPFVDSFERRGDEVVVTARDTGMTYELLHQVGTPFAPIGSVFGKGARRKLTGGLSRTAALARHMRRVGDVAILLSSSRPSALAARVLGVPAFVICDYEHVELASYRRLGAALLFPDVIDQRVFANLGFSADRLLPFRGLKEDMTFIGQGLTAELPRELARNDRLVYVLLRPPAEDSHYFKAESASLVDDVLDVLAKAEDVRLVVVPRHATQVDLLDRWRWINRPILLRRAVPTISLLTAVDWVICSGGTMLREAAYLGTPAISIFRGELGAVDAYLASLGAIRILADARELVDLDWNRHDLGQAVPHRPEVVAEIVDELARRTQGRTPDYV